MVQRRNNQEGTIYRLPSGRWRAQISVNGHRFGFTADTRQICSSWLRKFPIESQLNDRPIAEKKTYGIFLEGWLIGVRAALRTTTWSQYKYHIKAHILPALGVIPLDELRPDQIQALYDEMVKAGYGTRTIQVTHVVIHRSLSQAVKLGLISKNPDDATTPPRVIHHEMKFYDESQVTQFLISAKGDRNEVLYYLALYTGMRQSEILALRWADVDWEHRTIRVQRQVRRDWNKGDMYSPPKTRAGKRSVMLGTNGIAKLREHWQRQNRERLVAGERWKDYDLIFPSTIGTPMNHSNLVKAFKQLIKRAGLPDIRFHDLRHTAASLMLNNGTPPIIASRRLGHSRVSITLDTYGHLMPEMQSDVADLMDELITPIPINCTQLHTAMVIPQNLKPEPPYMGG